MIHSVKKRVRQVIALCLIVVTGPVLGGGGDWKMGPFGPYWDDNSWPEFTPMYWMEEFMNRLDDDDDEIQTWMLRNQFPGQSSGMRGVYPQDNWQPDAWTGSRAQSDDRAYTRPYPGVPAGNTYIIGENNPTADAPEENSGPLPYLTPEEFARMPIELQREYKRAFDREYPIVPRSKPKSKPVSETKRRSLPNLTPQEYARMPAELQREYKRAFDREYYGASRRAPDREPGPLPNLSSREYARMPAELQREYRRAFDREYGASPRPPSYQPSNRKRPSLPMLTPEEYARMPVDLQRQYEREFNREYAEYQARNKEARPPRNVAPSRRSRAGGYP